MKSSILILYKYFADLFYSILRLIAFINPTLSVLYSVRNNLFKELKNNTENIPTSGVRIWVHVASVGEFEQARPVITALKNKYSDLIVFVSFLSNSGYDARKNYSEASVVFYHPIDTHFNAEKIISLLKPDYLLLMRYDFWPNHLLEAKRYGTKLILVAAVLPDNTYYFNPLLKRYYQDIFQLFDRIYSISSKDTFVFRNVFKCQRVETAGDPRFDQVLLRSKNTSKVDYLKPYFENKIVLIAGSVRTQDEAILLNAWQKLKKRPALVLVPHEVNINNMERLYHDLHNRLISKGQFPEALLRKRISN